MAASNKGKTFPFLPQNPLPQPEGDFCVSNCTTNRSLAISRRAAASGIQSPGEGRYMVARGGAPKGREPRESATKTNANPGRGGIMRGAKYRIVSKYRKHKKHAPTTARSSASLRSSPSYAALVAFADAQAARARIPFLRFPGVPRLRRSTPGYYLPPLPGLKFRLQSSLLRSYAEAGRRSTPGYSLPPLPGLKFRLPSSLLRSYA